MFCPKCGKELAEDAQFCTKCGLQVKAEGKEKRITPLAIASIMVLVVVLAFAAFALFSGFFNNASTQDGDAKSGSGTAAQADDLQSDESISDDAKATIDLTSPDDYANLNLFLSNFTEVLANTEFDTASASSEDLARFAVYHCGRNTPSDWEYAPMTTNYYDILGTAGGWNGHYNVRVSGERVSEVVRRYFGIEMDYSDITGSYRGPYHYEDGYVYFGVTGGVGTPTGVALAESCDEVDGSIYVTFSVYGGPDYYYNAIDQSYYSLTPQELMSRMELNGPWLTGSAVLSVGDYDEYTGGLILHQYSAQRLADLNQAAQTSGAAEQNKEEDSPAVANTLSGLYEMSANHTVEFDEDGSCIMQDNGVSWSGSYKYDASVGSYKLTINSLGGTVETYVFTPSGDDLVLHQNGYEFTYEKK